ncbi:MAG: hypothetical protein KJ015_09870 [Myxococcales bacterium]|nr:hypothetical protein [Myxococcales bacterium]
MTEEDREPPSERFYVRPTEAGAAQALEDAIVIWINEIRAKKGLPPLQEDEQAERDEA